MKSSYMACLSVINPEDVRELREVGRFTKAFTLGTIPSDSKERREEKLSVIKQTSWGIPGMNRNPEQWKVPGIDEGDPR